MNLGQNDISKPFIPRDVAMMVVREKVPLFRAWRVRLGMTIDQIAVAAGMSLEEVWQLDRTENGFSEALMKAARIMNLDFDQLLDVDD